MLDDLRHQAPHLGSFDTDARNQVGLTIPSDEIDLCPPMPGNVDVRRFMVCRIDHEPKAVGAMHDNHCNITHPFGFQGLAAAPAAADVRLLAGLIAPVIDPRVKIR